MESSHQRTDSLSRKNKHAHFSDRVRDMERNFPDDIFDIFFNFMTLILTLKKLFIHSFQCLKSEE